MSGEGRLLERAGKFLWGEAWHLPLARHFGLDITHLHAMARGAKPVPVGLLMDVETELRDRAHRLDRLLEAFCAEEDATDWPSLIYPSQGEP